MSKGSRKLRKEKIRAKRDAKEKRQKSKKAQDEWYKKHAKKVSEKLEENKIRLEEVVSKAGMYVKGDVIVYENRQIPYRFIDGERFRISLLDGEQKIFRINSPNLKREISDYVRQYGIWTPEG